MHNVQRINYPRDNYSKTARRQWSNWSRRPPNPVVYKCMFVMHSHASLSLAEIIHICTWSALGRIICTCNASLCDCARRIMHAAPRVYYMCTDFFLNPGVMWWRSTRRVLGLGTPDHEPTTRAQVRRQMHASTSLLSQQMVVM